MKPTPSSGHLLYLLADLARDPELAQQLAQDPLAVFTQYGLPDDKLATLRGRNLDHIVGTVVNELHAILENARKPPIVGNPWPANQVQVTSCDPGRGSLGSPIAFTVKGRMFQDDATLSFVAPGATVSGSDVHVTSDPEGNSTLTANATFSVASVYDVTVSNPGDGYGTLPSGFIAQK